MLPLRAPVVDFRSGVEWNFDKKNVGGASQTPLVLTGRRGEARRGLGAGFSFSLVLVTEGATGEDLCFGESNNGKKNPSSFSPPLPSQDVE